MTLPQPNIEIVMKSLADLGITNIDHTTQDNMKSCNRVYHKIVFKFGANIIFTFEIEENIKYSHSIFRYIKNHGITASVNGLNYALDSDRMDSELIWGYIERLASGQSFKDIEDSYHIFQLENEIKANEDKILAITIENEIKRFDILMLKNPIENRDIRREARKTVREYQELKLKGNFEYNLLEYLALHGIIF